MMNESLELYIITLLIDNFEDYNSVLKEMNEANYDNFFIDKDGNKLDYLVVFFTRSKYMIIDDVIDSLYTYLVEMEDELLYPISKIVNYLCRKFVTYSYNNDDVFLKDIIGYIENNNLENVVKRFKDDYDFGMTLLDNALQGIANPKKCYKNLGNILEDGKIYQVNKWFDKDGIFLEGSYNDDLRDCICSLFNHLISIGFSQKDALKYTWQFFERDFDPTGIIAKYGNEYFPFILKAEILKLMYADIYEDICNNGKEKYLTLEERKMVVAVFIAVHFNYLVLPYPEIREVFLNRFLNLRYDYIQRKENRSKMYQDERINLLKKVNPSFRYDELTF